MRSGDALQVNALKALFSVSREVAVDVALTILLQSQQPTLTAGVFNAIAESAGSPDLLAERLKTAIVDPKQVKRLRAAWISIGFVQEQLTARLDQIAGVKTPGLEYSERLVAELVAAARTGDPVKGKATFHSSDIGCAACHKVGDAGGVIGPDLSALGSGVPPERIVTEVLWPGTQVKEGFSLTLLTLKDGSALQGYPQKSRDEKKLLLRDFATGQTREIPTGEIRQREDIGSLMPPTAQSLPRAELVDLLAWLISLRGTDPNPEKAE